MIMRGMVKSFNFRNRYGFIESETGDTHFFYATEWHIKLKPKKGLNVEFTPVEVEKGKRATNIRLIWKRRKTDGNAG